ncbi:MAG: AAA family ATPase [Pseudomonadota bacterium]
MYEQHFNLRDKPFSLIPAADAVYFSPGHKAAFATLEFGLHEQVGLTLITGDVGSGKTTLVRHLMHRIDYQELTLGLVSTTHRSFGTLLRWIVNALRINSGSKATLLQTIQDCLLAEYAAGKRTVIIVDEAQNLTLDELETLRLLTNINADGHQLLQVILVGQHQLREKFGDPRMGQLAQRVSAESTLGPLSAEETSGYVRYRLTKVGGAPGIFDAPALQAVYYFSAGLPRIINTLCDGAMVSAYAQQRDSIDLDIVLDVVKSKQIGGIYRPGIKSNPNRVAVREGVISAQGIDMLELVG